MIYVFIALLGLVVAGWYLEKRYEGIGFIIALVSGLLLVTSLIIWPCNYYREVGNIQEYYAVKNTIEKSRETDSELLERAALLIEMSRVNAWLQKQQYWNETMFDIYIPDEVMILEPLK